MVSASADLATSSAMPPANHPLAVLAPETESRTGRQLEG